MRLKKLRAQSACAVVLASTAQLRKKKDATTQHGHGTLYSGKTKISIQHCTKVIILFSIHLMTRNSMASSNSLSDLQKDKKTTWVHRIYLS